MACAHGLLVLGPALVAAGQSPSSSGAPPVEDTRPAVVEALAAGDAHYARRAEGAVGGTALPFHAEGAIVEYRRALALDERSLHARLGLMRAIFFRTGFCGPMEKRDKVRLLDEAKKVAQQAVAQLESPAARTNGGDPAPPADEGLPHARTLAAAEVFLWAAVSWGQWALHHRLSAGLQGAPKRIRDLAETVISIEPATAQFGAYVILGRLHCEAPRVPGFTGWVSCEKGLSALRQGLAGAPDNQALVYFLADELLRGDRSGRDEARALLERCAESLPRAEFPVEDAHYAELARQRLAAMR